jgi:MoaA/NifB/PqqE/SkfB family radical SAM enzyme
MPVEIFEKIVQKLHNEGYKQIALFNWTDPFINPNLHEYVAIVKQHGLYCLVSTNFSFRRIPGLEVALRSGLDHLMVTVSGFDQEVYQVNHVGGNIAYVKDYLRRAAEYKASGIVSTHIVLRFLRFPYNQDQEEKLEALSNELNVEFQPIAGSGDPKGQLMIPTNDNYEDILRSYRFERPLDAPGKV